MSNQERDTWTVRILPDDIRRERVDAIRQLLNALGGPTATWSARILAPPLEAILWSATNGLRHMSVDGEGKVIPRMGQEKETER